MYVLLLFQNTQHRMQNAVLINTLGPLIMHVNGWWTCSSHALRRRACLCVPYILEWDGVIVGQPPSLKKQYSIHFFLRLRKDRYGLCSSHSLLPSDLPVSAKRNDSTTVAIQYRVRDVNIHELSMSVSQIHTCI